MNEFGQESGTVFLQRCILALQVVLILSAHNISHSGKVTFLTLGQQTGEVGGHSAPILEGCHQRVG
jgi:hypothetical protein